MVAEPRQYSYDDLNLSSYLNPLLQYWWICLAVFLVIVMLGVVQVNRQPDIYEARTKVLILSPVSERLLGDEGTPGNRLPINPFLGSKISVDTLASLGTANDLLQDIIERLGLRASATGELWSVERLRSIISVRIENPGGAQASLPLLTMTARSEDPDVVKRVAETWAELFIDQNSNIFATEAARSYNFVVGQFNDTEEELRLKEAEILQLERLNSLQTLQSQLRVLTAKYEEFLGRLLERRSELVGARALLASTEDALANEPQVVMLEQSIPISALFVLLASEGGGLDLNGVTELVSVNEERNDLYFSLKNTVINARSRVSTLTSDIAYYDTQTLSLQIEIIEISSQISERRLSQNRLNQEVTLLTETFNRLARSLQQSQITKEEQSGFIQIVESAVKPRVPLARDGQRTILIAGVGGLMLGVAMAFVVYFVQEAKRSRRREETPQDS